MHLRNLLSTMHRCRKYRNDYKIVWNFFAYTDYTNYLFCLLPTIYWQPWPFRQMDTSVLELHWLNWHVCLFKWVSVRDRRKENE